jgi:hypothetical protein
MSGSSYYRYRRRMVEGQTLKRPQYKGDLERSNRIFREEFYTQPSLAHSIVELNLDLKKALKKYHDYRLHYALHLAAPMEYLNHHYLRGLQSQM